MFFHFFFGDQIYGSGSGEEITPEVLWLFCPKGIFIQLPKRSGRGVVEGSNGLQQGISWRSCQEYFGFWKRNQVLGVCDEHGGSRRKTERREALFVFSFFSETFLSKGTKMFLPEPPKTSRQLIFRRGQPPILLEIPVIPEKKTEQGTGFRLQKAERPRFLGGVVHTRP